MLSFLFSFKMFSSTTTRFVFYLVSIIHFSLLLFSYFFFLFLLFHITVFLLFLLLSTPAFDSSLSLSPFCPFLSITYSSPLPSSSNLTDVSYSCCLFRLLRPFHLLRLFRLHFPNSCSQISAPSLLISSPFSPSSPPQNLPLLLCPPSACLQFFSSCTPYYTLLFLFPLLYL